MASRGVIRLLTQTPELEAGRSESRLSMSWGYFDIDSQRPTKMRWSDTLMISSFAAIPGIPLVTRKEAFFMARAFRQDDAANELAENTENRKGGEENGDSP